MAKLLMITGLGSAMDLASGKKGAFFNTLEEFHKYWERIDIIAPKIKGETGTKEFFGNVYVHISPWPLVLHPFWFLKKGLEIFKQQKFDLMTVQDFPPFYNGIGARMLWGKIKIPYVLEIHHIPGYPRPANIKELLYKNFLRIFIEADTKEAKAVRVVNQNQVPEFLISSGVSKNKIIYIPSLYIDLDIFKPMVIQKEYDLIFIGRLEPNKGVDLLLKAVSKVKIQIPNVKCLIVGAGPLKTHLSLEISHSSLSDNVKLYGFAKDSHEIAELINKSRILIMPSYNEGGPRVVVEAMACGVPVLATPVGIVPDLLKNNQGGEMIAWDAEDIAKKAGMLLSDPIRYDKLSSEAVEMASRFERKSQIENYARKLQNIIHPEP